LSRIFWDTNPYIYLFENNPIFAPSVSQLRLRMLERGDELVTSFMTVGEIQVKGLKEGRLDMAADLKQRVLLTSTVLHFDHNAANAYALIRATTNAKGPDAIQLACASAYGVDYFFTNDTNLTKLTVRGIGEIRTWTHFP
jgi:predicted nucleic acid-binding protein